MACFFFIMIYGFFWKSLFAEDMEPEPAQFFSTINGVPKQPNDMPRRHSTYELLPTSFSME